MRRAAWLFVGLSACDVGGEAAQNRGAPPSVVRATYDDGDSGDLEVPLGSGVPRGIAIDVWFDRFLDPASVDALSIRVESGTLTVSASVFLDPLDRRVRVLPTRSLDPSLAYRLVVTREVRSLEGTPAQEYRLDFSTGQDEGGAPPSAEPVGWDLAEPKIASTCGGRGCHGDGVSLPACGDGLPFGQAKDYLPAVGLDLDDPLGLTETAIDVRAIGWPEMLRVEPGRPDRSYAVYKMIDWDEELIVGYVMPSEEHPGAGASANGDVLEGFCCPEDSLPIVHPPPFEEPTGRFDPMFHRRRSGERSDPFVFECACLDRRGRFGAPQGVCNVAEDRCSDGEDEDGDGLLDCDDPNCHWSPECDQAELACDDGEDEDGDSLADCDDPDCVMRGTCPDAEAACVDASDCSDPRCAAKDFCCETDVDADGRPDCVGPICGFVPACNPGLGAPPARAVSYCRARLVVDWISQGAPLGPGRQTCAQTCALRCDEDLAYGDCLADCLARPFDADLAGCVRDRLCEAYDGELPDLDVDDGVIGLGPVGEAETCRATCAGPLVASCDGGSSCDGACTMACADLSGTCPSLSSCTP